MVNQPAPNCCFAMAAATAIGIAHGDALMAPPPKALADGNELTCVRRSISPVVCRILARTTALVALAQALVVRGWQRVEARLPEHGFPRDETSHIGRVLTVQTLKAGASCPMSSTTRAPRDDVGASAALVAEAG